MTEKIVDCDVKNQTKQTRLPIAFRFAYTGQPCYLKVHGNGENASSYPKFDISKM